MTGYVVWFRGDRGAPWEMVATGATYSDAVRAVTLGVRGACEGRVTSWCCRWAASRDRCSRRRDNDRGVGQ